MKEISHQVVVSHPTGNQNCRSVLAILEAKRVLAWFGTMWGFSTHFPLKVLPVRLQEQLSRRAYALPASKIRLGGIQEIIRLISKSLGWKKLISHEASWASIDRVYSTLDRFVARKLRKDEACAVYAYEDGALQTFRRAKKLGIPCIYELPIAYWQTVHCLLKEEEIRYPEWISTLKGRGDSLAKLERKTEELALADLIICPSNFVAESIPSSLHTARTATIPYGSPSVAHSTQPLTKNGKIRVLFVGSFTQRKGLADLFQAIRLLKRKDIELVLLGTPIAPLEFYRTQLPRFTYAEPRAHHRILEFMSTCDIFILPSLVEGRALVVQEAMSRGLPIIITPNTGVEDVIENSDCGFMVPIRSPESLAEKIDLLADTPNLRRTMGEKGRTKAAEMSWKVHGEKIWKEIESLLQN